MDHCTTNTRTNSKLTAGAYLMFCTFESTKEHFNSLAQMPRPNHSTSFLFEQANNAWQDVHPTLQVSHQYVIVDSTPR